MGKTIGAGLLGLVALVALPAGATEPEAPHREAYLRYCGACHGHRGQGDGVAAPFLQPKPPDLTVLAKKNDGQFPHMRVMRIIDGRDTLRAHGDAAMPVWGEVFHDQTSWTQATRAEVQGKIMAITDYLRSIQAK